MATTQSRGVCPSVCLHVCPSICLSVCLSSCLLTSSIAIANMWVRQAGLDKAVPLHLAGCCELIVDRGDKHSVKIAFKAEKREESITKIKNSL